MQRSGRPPERMQYSRQVSEWSPPGHGSGGNPYQHLVGQKKREQQHKKMIQSLEKNDKVRTIGGIIGTVVDIKEDEITLKIDESNNTKIKILRSAIGRNMSKDKN